jgi:hypothetical protein
VLANVEVLVVVLGQSNLLLVELELEVRHVIFGL